MIDLYTWTTPNGRKVSILLEELGLEYEAHQINIGQGDQKTPEFLKISPNNKIPAIVERDTGFSLMESGAIMIYLAEKHGRFIPTDLQEKARVVEWLMWQMGGFGPMLGQAHHYLHFNPGKAEYAEGRFLLEERRKAEINASRTTSDLLMWRASASASSWTSRFSGILTVIVFTATLYYQMLERAIPNSPVTG